MKLSVNKILFHRYGKYNKYYKYWNVQLSLLWGISPTFTFTFTLDFVQYPSFELNILGLIVIHIYFSREQDHAGFYSNINIFGIDLDINYNDVRHWDYENDSWEQWEITN